MPQIALENIVKDYPVGSATIAAVRNATTSVERGQFVSIVGHSGSGKTTLLSLIGGMVRPTAGRVLFNGQDVYAWDSDRLSEYRCEKVGFMFQSASLLPVLTARENLLLPAAFHSKPAAGHERRAEDLLRAVGLGDKLHAYPSQLSGGQQRRVAIARAFMNEPELILADEPTGDLDEETESEMMQFFLRMNAERGTTFLMVTHNSDLAGRARQRFRMDRGELTVLQ
ncbi:MAG: ABC transporter ATP-binding protein [Nitrospiraceae bacterium]|nr:ABC transporter ATP-binding protein [Nitrospiraceae bacterium]